MNNTFTTHKHNTKYNYNNTQINNKLPKQKKLNNNQTNTQSVMPRKTTKATPKSPKKYASKNLSKLKNIQKSTVKVDKSNKKYGHPPRTKKYNTNKHANNNKKARRFSLLSDDSSDISFSNDEEEIDGMDSDQGSIDVEIEDYESSEDEDEEDDDDDEEDTSSSDSDVDFVKLTAQRKKALKAAKGLATKRTGHKTTGNSKRKASMHEPKVQTNNSNDVDNNNDNHSEDDDSDINFSFEFELSDNENVAAKLEKEDVGEEVKNVAAGSDKRKNSTKKKLQRRLTNLDKANLLPVPKINEDSDSPLSSVDTSDNENAILTDSSSDEGEDEEGGDNAKSTINDDDDDQEIDNDKLAAAIAADENDHPDAYDDETLAEKKKKKLRGLKSRGNSIIGVPSSKSSTGYSDNDNENAVLSDDDDFLDRETAILLDQIKSENDLYFMNDGFLNNNDIFSGLDNEGLLNVHSNSSNDNSLKKPIVPRMSIVEDPKDVVLREKLRKKVNSRRASKVENSNNNNGKNADEDDDEVIEFVSDDEDKKKNNGINKNDDDDESEIELSVFDDLYYKSSAPFSFSSLNLNNDENNNKNDNKYLDAYDQTGDDAYFWDYLLGDGNSNIENGSGNNEPSNSNLVDVSNKLKKIRTKSNRSNSTRKFSNQQKNNINSRHASISKSQHNAKRTSTGHHDSMGNMGAMSFDLALGTNEDFMDYQTFLSEEDDELTDEEENLPISSAKNIGSRTVKEVLSSAKVNGGGAPRMATWIAAKDRPFEIIDGLTTRSVLPYTKNSNSSYTISSGNVGIEGKAGSSSSNNAIHKRNVSIGSDLKFDEFFNLSELEENIDDSINWTALTSNSSLNKRKVPLTAFRNKSSSSNNGNIAGSNATEFSRRYSNVASAAMSSRASFSSNNLNGNNGGASSGVVSNSSNAGNHDNTRSQSNGKARSFRAHSVSNSNKIRRSLKQNLLKQQPKDSKFIINNKPAVTSANNSNITTKKRRQSSVMEANQEGLVFTENGLFSENVLLGVEEFLAETGDIDNDELSGLLSGIQF